MSTYNQLHIKNLKHFKSLFFILIKFIHKKKDICLYTLFQVYFYIFILKI